MSHCDAKPKIAGRVVPGESQLSSLLGALTSESVSGVTQCFSPGIALCIETQAEHRTKPIERVGVTPTKIKRSLR